MKATERRRGFLRRPRGASLYTTLLFLFLVFVVFVVVAAAFVRMTFFNANSAAELQARYAARSAISSALYELQLDDDFGKDGAAEIIEREGDLGPGQTARLTFNKKSGVPYSVNNLNSDSIITGYNDRPVPADGVQLVGIGRFAGMEYIEEVIVVQPGILHAAASSGQLILEGKNEAARLQTTLELEQMTSGGRVTPSAVDDELRETSVAVSNSQGAPMILDGELTLYGDAISAGQVLERGQVTFLRNGRIKQNEADVKIPRIDNIGSYDPNAPGQTLGFVTMDPAYPGPNTFKALYRRDGDLEITGEAELKGALIFATGNITVRGNLNGQGAIIALGDILIEGQASLRADSKVAVLAGQNLKVVGTGQDSAMFAGLLYAQGELEVSNITSVGAVVANNPTTPENAVMRVTETRLINLREKTKFDIRAEVAPPPPPPPPVGLYGRALGLMERDGFKLIEPDINDYIESDGTWNGTDPVLKIEYGGIVYDGPDTVADIDRYTLTQLQGQYNIAVTTWAAYLNGLQPQTQETVPIFQLEPNELLTWTAATKIAYRRRI